MEESSAQGEGQSSLVVVVGRIVFSQSPQGVKMSKEENAKVSLLIHSRKMVC